MHLKMASQRFVSAITLMILLCKGCLSQQPPACIAVASNNGRIVGGQDAPPGAWPWQAVLNKDGSFFCGGSLITDQWVLTAAHCITPADLATTVVYLGRQTLSGSNPNEVMLTLESIICHPQYDSNTMDNDMCLLKLSSPVSFTDYIKPVCLASADSTFFDGTISWVTGFGDVGNGSQPETLQEVEMPIVGNNRCGCNYQGSNQITDNMLCAGLLSGGKDSCQGDSGGPIVSKKEFYWVQSGVVSFGVGCGLPEKPGVYARVSKYQDWISGTVTGTAPGFVTFTSTSIDEDQSFICIPSSPTPPSPPTTTENSIFGGCGNLIHFTHVLPISVLALILHVFIFSG